MTIRTVAATCALVSALAVGSTFAQGAMSSMSKADMDKMTACKAMTHDAMMKDAKCVEMSKMHADSMKKSGAMAPMGGTETKDKMGPTPPAK